MRLKKNNRGMTLVEAIVGIALFAICGTILVTSFTAAASLMRKGQDLKVAGQQAAAVLDGDESSADMGTAQSSGALSFSVDGTQITIPGNYTTASDGNGNTIYQLFVSGS